MPPTRAHPSLKRAKLQTSAQSPAQLEASGGPFSHLSFG
jgi:hypothetical protein